MSWTHTVEAYNTALDSTNRMHDDAVAQTFGFSGGLVPGVDVWAYMTRPCVDRWGRDFLTRSVMDARFVSPVYDGEVVVAELTDDGALTVTGPDGTVRATGHASLVDHLPAPELIAAGTLLGTLRLIHDQELGAVYLREVGDDHRIYEAGAVCHPGFLARQANAALHRNVVLGPWIHVGTRRCIEASLAPEPSWRYVAASLRSTNARGTGSSTSTSRSPRTVHRSGVRFTRRSGGRARRPEAADAAA